MNYNVVYGINLVGFNLNKEKLMSQENIRTLDLLFQGKKKAIASYAILSSHGVILIESGPGSTLESLKTELNTIGYELKDITDVLLTHIHLDHAGAAGKLAALGANIHVHPLGARHLTDPTKLISSATRIYAERMNKLWGEILPVPEDKLRIFKDGENFNIGSKQFRTIFTPGHAEHHACILFDGICFSGDVGAIRIPGYRYIRIPMPPPELDLSKWIASLKIIKQLKPDAIAPTHFGIYVDVDEHLNKAIETISEIKKWINKHFMKTLDHEILKLEFNDWMNGQARAENLSVEVIESFALSNPLDMSVDGMIRYWTKILHPQN